MYFNSLICFKHKIIEIPAQNDTFKEEKVNFVKLAGNRLLIVFVYTRKRKSPHRKGKRREKNGNKENDESSSCDTSASSESSESQQPAAKKKKKTHKCSHPGCPFERSKLSTVMRHQSTHSNDR